MDEISKNLLLTTGDDTSIGEVWSTIYEKYPIYGIDYSPDLDLCVATSLNSENVHIIITSNDLVNWVERPDLVYNSYSNPRSIVKYAEPYFFILVNSSSVPKSILRSDNGVDWTLVYDGGQKFLYDVIKAGNQYVVGGVDGFLMTSPDASTWTQQNTGLLNAQDIRTLAYNGTLIYAAGNFNQILTSSTGVTWNTINLSAGASIERLIFDGTKVIGVGYNMLYSSPSWGTQIFSDFLQDIIYTGSMYVILTSNKKTYISTDAISWSTPYTYQGRITDVNSFDRILYNSEKFIIYNSGTGKYYISTDAANWNLTFLSDKITSITYSSDLNLYVASGKQGKLITSTDLVNWNIIFPSNLYDLNVAENAGNLVAIESNQYKIYESTDGIVWTNTFDNISSGSPNIQPFGDGFIAIGLKFKNVIQKVGTTWSIYEQNAIGPASASDIGIICPIIYPNYLFLTSKYKQMSFVDSFTKVDTPIESGDNYLSISYDPNNGFFLKTGYSLQKSNDGINWSVVLNGKATDTSAADTQHPISYWDGSRMLFFTKTGSNYILKSINLSNNNITSISSITIFSIINDISYHLPDDEYIYVTGDGSIFSSIDGGVTWIDDGSTTFQGLYGSAPGTRRPVVGNNGTILSRANNGNWTLRTSGTTNNLKSIAWSGTLYVVVGDSGTILTSTDSVTWIIRSSGTTQNLNKVRWTGSTFIAVGTNKIVLTSSDGISWTTRTWTSSIFANPVDVSSNGSTFVSVGGLNLCAYSTDLINWTNRTYLFDSLNLNDIVYIQELSIYVIVGNSGIIKTSSDAISWTTQNSNTISDFLKVIWDGLQIIAYGPSIISTSYDGVVWTNADISQYFNSLTTLTSSGTRFVAVDTIDVKDTGPDKILTST